MFSAGAGAGRTSSSSWRFMYGDKTGFPDRGARRMACPGAANPALNHCGPGSVAQWRTRRGETRRAEHFGAFPGVCGQDRARRRKIPDVPPKIPQLLHTPRFFT
ncbi:Uncharacterised protein [Bordetella pertussis]|nr:Uncharacterised protein [Bordetella pertussis]